MKKVKYPISWFLLVVSIVMLIASVFPHHHHSGLVCLQPDTEQCDLSSPSSSSTSSGQATDCKTCCITKFQCAVPDHQWAVHLEPQVAFEPVLFALASGCLCPEYPGSIRICPSFYQEKLHSTHLSRALGLRAPPCIA